MTKYRKVVVIAMAGFFAWLALASIDRLYPYKLRLELIGITDTHGFLRSKCILKDSDLPLENAPQYLSPRNEPAIINLPLPSLDVIAVEVTFPDNYAVFDIHEIRVKQETSFLWPDVFVSNLPLSAIEPIEGVVSKSANADSGIRFYLDQHVASYARIDLATTLASRTIRPSIPHLQRLVSALFVAFACFSCLRYKSQLIGFSKSPACAILIHCFTLCLLLARNVSFVAPTIGSDELSYMQASFGISDGPSPPGYQRLHWDLPNLLYTAFGRFAFLVSDHGEKALMAFQVILYLLSSYVLWTLTRRLATLAWANVLAVLFAFYACHSYTSYFMPETLYSFLFLAMARIWSFGFDARPRTSAILSAFVCASMYYVKPHALSLMAALALCIVLAPWILRRPTTSLKVKITKSAAYGALFILSSLVFLVLLSYGLSPYKQGATAIFNFAAYTDSFKIMAAGSSLDWKTIASYAELAAAQLIVCSPYIFAAAFFVCRLLANGTQAKPDAESQTRLLILFTLVAFLATYSMTVHFTIRSGQQATLFSPLGRGLFFRVLGRYYSFIFPLFSVILAIGLSKCAAPKRTLHMPIITSIAFVALSLSLVYWALPKAAIWWYDFPESFGLNRLLGQALAIFCLAFQCAAMSFSNRPWLVQGLVCSLLLYFGFNAYHTYSESHHSNLITRYDSMAGDVFSREVPEVERASTLLISYNPEADYYFAFAFRHSPMTSKANRSHIPNIDELPAEVRWLVTESPANPQALNHRRLSLVAEFVTYKLYKIERTLE